ncbi:hypothetical protein VPH35_111840 [Triticum aestivum]
MSGSGNVWFVASSLSQEIGARVLLHLVGCKPVVDSSAPSRPDRVAWCEPTRRHHLRSMMDQHPGGENDCRDWIHAKNSYALTRDVVGYSRQSL